MKYDNTTQYRLIIQDNGASWFDTLFATSAWVRDNYTTFQIEEMGLWCLIFPSFPLRKADSRFRSNIIDKIVIVIVGVTTGPIDLDAWFKKTINKINDSDLTRKGFSLE